MKRQFEQLKEISDTETYNAVMKYLNEWVDYATKNGYFEHPDVENDYTREFSRIAGMCADYENIYLQFKNIKVKNPLLVTIEKEMRMKNLNQRQTAELLDVKENTFSQILSGKRNVSMNMAKKLHQIFKIDAGLIIKFA